MKIVLTSHTPGNSLRDLWGRNHTWRTRVLEIKSTLLALASASPALDQLLTSPPHLVPSGPLLSAHHIDGYAFPSLASRPPRGPVLCSLCLVHPRPPWAPDQVSLAIPLRPPRAPLVRLTTAVFK